MSGLRPGEEEAAAIDRAGRWAQGSPQWLALGRFHARTATIEDLFLIAFTEIQDCIESTPPVASAGDVDAMHANACAMRAKAMLRRIQASLDGLRPSDPETTDLERALAWLRAQDPSRCLDTRHPEVRSLALEFVAARRSFEGVAKVNT